MSLREKAREIKAAGEAERGNFDPQGKPLELYMQWRDDRLRRRKDVPTRENFCHFWRVVAIWVPLMKVRKAASRVADYEWSGPIAMGVIILGLLAGLVFGSVMDRDFLWFVLGVLGFFWLFAGVVIGVAWGGTDSDDPDIKYARGFGLATFPTAVPLWAITNVIKRVPQDIIENICKVVLVLIVAAVLVGSLIKGFFTIGFWVILVALGIPAVLAGLAFACVVLSDYVKGLQIRNETKGAAYDDEEDYTPRAPKAPREPGKVSKFFSAIADFIVLIAQVVRTKKWKICPLVTIPEGAPEDEEVFA